MKTISPAIMTFFIFSLLCLSTLSIPTSASEDFEIEPITLYPVADAYVNSFNPDKNHGDIIFLEVESNRYNKSVFIEFDLSQIPTDATILSAQLMLRGFSSKNNSGSVSVYYVPDDSWTDSGITYNNRPSSSIYLTDKENVSLKSWCSWDIKEDVITALWDDKSLTEVLRYENEGDYKHQLFQS